MVDGIDRRLNPPKIEKPPKQRDPISEKYSAENSMQIEDLMYSRQHSARMNKAEQVLWEADGGLERLLADIAKRKLER